jgi:hypothetical protein
MEIHCREHPSSVECDVDSRQIGPSDSLADSSIVCSRRLRTHLRRAGDDTPLIIDITIYSLIGYLDYVYLYPSNAGLQVLDNFNLSDLPTANDAGVTIGLFAKMNWDALSSPIPTRCDVEERPSELDIQYILSAQCDGRSSTHSSAALSYVQLPLTFERPF